MGKKKCLYCYKSLDSGGPPYHAGCSKKIYGAWPPPELPYTKDSMQDLAKEIIRDSITVPGVQEKISLHFFSGEKGGEGKTVPRFTLVGLWGNYILKPSIGPYPDISVIEDCTMHLAELCGIRTVPHALIPLAPGGKGQEDLAYITRRVDRSAEDNRPIHMEDFCQLAGRLTEDKYRGSLESCAAIIRKYSSNTMLDLLAFFELALFCFLSGNSDMHLKNFSLIYHDSGMISLAPAYDLVAVRLLIPEKLDREESALTMNGKKRNFTLNDFKTFGASCGLSPPQMENSFRKFRSRFPLLETGIAQSFLSAKSKGAYLKLLESRYARLGWMPPPGE